MRRLKSKKLLIILFGIIAVGCISAFAYFKSISNRPNIILITIDALRPDHLGCYGYERNTSPNIDRLAKEGVVFRNCFATSSNTVFASPGYHTGRYLGIKNKNIGKFIFMNNLDKKFNTLAEYLKKLGYYTVALPSSNNIFYRAGSGYEQGFDIYKNSNGRLKGHAKAMTDEIINFLNSRSGNKPFFIWIHYMETHSPYTPPKEYLKIFENDRLYIENDKTLKSIPDNLESKNNFYSPWQSEGYIPAVFHKDKYKLNYYKDKYNLNYYIACYDAEIRHTDYHIGRLLENIKDNTLIILTADHGESLGEHNVYFYHGNNIYDEVLHIPLIIKDNRDFQSGKRICTVVSSVDIVPTILNMINPIWYFFNKHRFNGIDLKRIVNGKDIKREYIYSYFPWAYSIRDANKNIKYILNEDGREELYLLPDENNNLINDNSLEVIYIRKELRDKLKTWLKNYPIRSDINPKKVSISEETKEALRSLGYIQ